MTLSIFKWLDLCSIREDIKSISNHKYFWHNYNPECLFSFAWISLRILYNVFWLYSLTFSLTLPDPRYFLTHCILWHPATHEVQSICVDFHWSIIKLPGVSTLEENWLSFSRKLSVANNCLTAGGSMYLTLLSLFGFGLPWDLVHAHNH